MNTIFEDKVKNFPTIAAIEARRTLKGLKNRYDLYCYLIDIILDKAENTHGIVIKFIIYREEIASNYENGKYAVSIYQNWEELIRVMSAGVCKIRPEIKLGVTNNYDLQVVIS
jgi:hypothetical protein